jgi:iron complex transport system permease protein
MRRRELGLAALAWLVVATAALLVGSSALSVRDVAAVLGGGGDALSRAIVLDARLPSVLLASVVGAMLAPAGAVVQGMTRNPLAEPYLLGVSGGASLGVAAVLAIAGSAPWHAGATSLGAFVGALAALVVVTRVSSGAATAEGARHAPLLAGVVVNAVAASALMLAHALLEPLRSRDLLMWMMGGIVPGRLTEWGAVPVALGLLATAWLAVSAARVNLLSLGDPEASTAGLDVASARRQLLVASSLAVASAVALSGMIGFVGLVVPHVVRRLVGGDARRVVPLCAVCGAAFVVVADAATRGLFGLVGSSLPVGAVTALVGGPFFLLAMRDATRRGQP